MYVEDQIINRIIHRKSGQIQNLISWGCANLHIAFSSFNEKLNEQNCCFNKLFISLFIIQNSFNKTLVMKKCMESFQLFILFYLLSYSLWRSTKRFNLRARKKIKSKIRHLTFYYLIKFLVWIQFVCWDWVWV